MDPAAARSSRGMEVEDSLLDRETGVLRAGYKSSRTARRHYPYRLLFGMLQHGISKGGIDTQDEPFSRGPAGTQTCNSWDVLSNEARNFAGARGICSSCRRWKGPDRRGDMIKAMARSRFIGIGFPDDSMHLTGADFQKRPPSQRAMVKVREVCS